MKSIPDVPTQPREVLNSRIPAAERSLVDRAPMLVTAESFDTFLALLDASAQPNPRLRRTLQTAPPWPEV